MSTIPFRPARPADELCGPARGRHEGGWRRLGFGVLLAFTLKGLLTGSLMLAAVLQLTGD